MQSGVPKQTLHAMGLKEKIWPFNQLCSDISHRAIDPECNVNEPTVHIKKMSLSRNIPPYKATYLPIDPLRKMR